jgi:ribosome-binding protein aMBF1 (putative translation factor)
MELTVEFYELGEKVRKMKKTNFDLYLEEQMRNPDFAERFERAGEAWDVAMQIASLRRRAGLSQNELARKLRTSQQNISRLESPAYEGHSLATLRRVAKALGATVRVTIEANTGAATISEPTTPYKVRRSE